MTFKNIFLALLIAFVIIAIAVGGVFWFGKLGGNKKLEESDIKVFTPEVGQTISSPLQVSGEARGTWFFEASFPIKIQDESGNVLGSSYAKAKSDWMTENFVPFSGEVLYALKVRANGFLVLSKDNPSGLPQNDKEVRIPVVLEPGGYAKIKVFFNNSKMDPEASCNRVFPAEREILKIEAIGSAALWQLLIGPTEEEKALGFFTSINENVKMQSLEIDQNGTAKVDFDDQLEKGVGGSCRVSAIRAQIIETLKQFPTVKNVIISINGRTEDILQP